MLKIKIMNLIKCRGCKKEYTPDMFINKQEWKKKQCKRCPSCRDKNNILMEKHLKKIGIYRCELCNTPMRNTKAMKERHIKQNICHKGKPSIKDE